MLSLDFRSVLPFLKYPGGKRKLLPHYDDHFPKILFGRYFEPMVGGGSLPLIWSSRWAGGSSICDINPDVIAAYRGIQLDPYGVAAGVTSLVNRYNNSSNPEAFYYDIRGIFNSGDRRPQHLVFLNQAGYNGLVRYNKSGMFNTPWGHKEFLNMSVVDRVVRAGTLLRRRVVEVLPAQDFSWVEHRAVSGDLVYFDPPYLSPGGFTKYWGDDFALQEHINLRDLSLRLAGRGVQIRIANADTPEVRDIYSDFSLVSVQAARPINRDKAGRGSVRELLIKEPNGTSVR